MDGFEWSLTLNSSKHKSPGQSNLNSCPPPGNVIWARLHFFFPPGGDSVLSPANSCFSRRATCVTLIGCGRWLYTQVCSSIWWTPSMYTTMEIIYYSIDVHDQSHHFINPVVNLCFTGHQTKVNMNKSGPTAKWVWAFAIHGSYSWKRYEPFWD